MRRRRLVVLVGDSPTMVSTRSSIVTSPSMPPYSSTTSARCIRAWRICSSRSSTGICGATISGRRSTCSSRNCLRPADIAEHVLDVDHAHDVVELAAIDRQAGMALAADQRDRLLEGAVGGDRHDVGARHHHVVGRGAAQPQHVGDQRPLLAVQLGRRAGRLRRLGRFLHQFGDRLRDAVLDAAPAQPPRRRPSSPAPSLSRAWPLMGAATGWARRAGAGCAPPPAPSAAPRRRRHGRGRRRCRQPCTTRWARWCAGRRPAAAASRRTTPQARIISPARRGPGGGGKVSTLVGLLRPRWRRIQPPHRRDPTPAPPRRHHPRRAPRAARSLSARGTAAASGGPPR